jgi:hypothetical protein
MAKNIEDSLAIYRNLTKRNLWYLMSITLYFNKKSSKKWMYQQAMRPKIMLQLVY